MQTTNSALRSNLTFACLLEKLDLLAVDKTVMDALNRRTFGNTHASSSKSLKQTKSTADFFEAVMGAFYLESGFEATCEWVAKVYEPLINASSQVYKSKSVIPAQTSTRPITHRLLSHKPRKRPLLHRLSDASRSPTSARPSYTCEFSLTWRRAGLVFSSLTVASINARGSGLKNDYYARLSLRRRKASISCGIQPTRIVIDLTSLDDDADWIINEGPVGSLSLV